MLHNSMDIDGVTPEDDIEVDGMGKRPSQLEGLRCDDYKGLLQSMTQLKSDLELNISRASMFEKENTLLHREQKELKTELSNIETRFNETKKSMLQIMDTITLRERGLNDVESKWRGIVEKERKEIEEQRDIYLNQVEGAQNLRYQIRQEIEKDYEQQAQILLKEKDEWEDKYHMMKRQYELGEVQSKVLIDTLTKEVEATKKSKDEEVAEMQEVLTTHIERTANSDTQLDQMRLEVVEANSQIEKMTISERELRRDLQEALDGRAKEESLKNTAISTYEVDLTEIKSSFSLKEAQCQALSIEVGHLKKSIETLHISMKQKCNEILSLSRKISTVESQLQEKDDYLYQLKEDFKVERHQINAQVKTESNKLKQENLSLLRQKQIIENHLKEGRTQLNQMKTELVTKEESARRDIEVRVNNMTLENSKLLLKMSNLESELKLKEGDHYISMEKLVRNCETYKHDSMLVINEKNALSKKYTLLEEVLDELKGKHEESHQQLESTSLDVTKLQRKLESYEEKNCDKETEICVLKTKLEKSIQDKEGLDSVHLEEKEQLKFEIKTLKSKCESERQAMKDQEKRLKSQISKEKRKAECYKEKAIDAHTKNIHAKHLLRQKEQHQTTAHSS